jgi:hypothetical protein
MAWDDLKHVLDDRALRNQAFRSAAWSLVRIGLVVAFVQLLNPQSWKSFPTLWLALFLILIGFPIQFYLIASQLTSDEPATHTRVFARNLDVVLFLCFFAIWWLIVPNPG